MWCPTPLFSHNHKAYILGILSIIMKITTIKLTQRFKEWIANLGKKGESYETILKRELKYKETNQEKNGHHKTKTED